LTFTIADEIYSETGKLHLKRPSKAEPSCRPKPDAAHLSEPGIVICLSRYTLAEYNIHMNMHMEKLIIYIEVINIEALIIKATFSFML